MQIGTMNSCIIIISFLPFLIIYDTICDQLPPVINVGYLYMPSFDGANESSLAAIKAAEQKLKENQILPDYVQFEIKWSQISCDEYNGSMEFIRLNEDEKIDSMMGPPCSPSADVIGRIAVSYNVLCISHLTDDYIFTNIALYQTYARTTRKDINQIAGALYKFLVLNGWTTVALLTRTSDDYARLVVEGVRDMFDNGIRYNLTDQPMHVAVDLQYEDSQQDLTQYLQQIKKSARIVIPIVGESMDGSSNLMLQAHKANMTGPEWAWVFMDLSPNHAKLDPWQTYDERDVVVDRNEIKEAYRAAITIALRMRDTDAQLRFIDSLRAVYKQMNPRRPISDYEFKDSQAALYDATYAYGTLLNETVTNGMKYNDGKGLFSLLRWRYIEIDADTAPVMFDGIMDIAPFYVIEAFNRDNKWGINWNVNRFRNNSEFHFDYDFELVSTKFIWRTENDQPPLDVPVCDFDGSLCIEDNSLPAWVWVFIGLAIAIGLTLVVTIYMKKMKDLEMQNLNWLIDHTKLVESGKRATSRNSAGSGSLLSDSNTSSQNTNLNYHDRLLTGTYDGQPCHIFKYATTKEVRIRNEQLRILKNIKALNQENLGYFLGLAVVSREQLLVLWSCLSNKTLRDVLENRDMPLDDDFLATFLRGAVNGLKYIHHSGLGVHGHLTSETCSVDSRFVLKMSQFGMAPLLSDLAEDEVIKIEREAYELYHCAPEIMVDAARGATPGSKAADVYALAMIFYQIVSRKKLFYDYNGTDESLVARIQDTRKLPLRPTFPDDISLSWMGIIGLVKDCWAHDPTARPTVDMVHSGVSVATSQFRGNIIEKMIHRMERYTNDLEKVVSERTAEVHAQQERAERLLQQMLPKSVAEKLQAGIAVQPETFESATVMFTDIVKFTDMSSKHTAMEIVALLNELYSTFDDLIDQRDVYKVETIGDAYMVVSGVPNRTTKHAVEIALLGLALRDYVRGFDMPFLEEEPLRIRLGAHSGSVAAGVVGIKMPRYCLFGDTVHTASGMESSGVPLRLHISESTKKFLDGNSQFEVVLRGPIEIKGKGTQTTYFVEKKGTNKFSD